MDELGSWLDEWLLHLRAEDKSPKTLAAYTLGVRSFLTHLQTTDPTPTSPGEITTRHVRGWALAMTEHGYAASTRQLRLIAVSMWLGYIARSDDSDLETNPARDIALPTPVDTPVPVVPDEILTRLLAACAGSTFAARRDAAMLRMLLDTGVRRFELVGIDMDELDMRHQTALVHGKGRKDRSVVFGQRTALALTRYLRARAKHPAHGSPALFLAVRRNPRLAEFNAAWRLNPDGVKDMLQRRCADAGIEPLHPHQFRHTWAHDLLANGANEADVERLAGWSSPMMVRRYGRSMADERAQAAARRLARGDRI